MQAFVLFVHYVALACLHSFIIHCEVPIHLGLLLYRKKHRLFWKALRKGQLIFALVSWLASLIIALLVGSLAWDMHWSISSNMTMVEELIADKAEVRRAAHGERPFVYPYDLGSKQNWAEIMGNGRFAWLCPVRALPDGHWPTLKEGSGHFDISTEQLAQKAYKLSKSFVMSVACGYNGPHRLHCCCWHWCRILCRFGCGAACSSPPCGEPHLAVRPGDRVLVSHREAQWLYGRSMANGLEGPEGWFPRSCVDAERSKKYEVPHQHKLQGEWEIQAGRVAKVSGPVVHVTKARVPYLLREDGDATCLLGCRLLECGGETARWSNGEVWQRPVGMTEERGPARQAVEPKKDI